MDAVSYPNAEVERELNEQFVPYKPEISANQALARRFNVAWTPGLLVIDQDDKVQYRAYGFYPPRELTTLLRVARASTAFHKGEYKAALQAYSRLQEEASDTTFGPEILYWLGVSHYKNGDKEGLLKAWNTLIDRHGGSIWAEKVGFIRA